MIGQWAIYHDGWMLSTKVNRAAVGDLRRGLAPIRPTTVLELYDLNKDFSQSDNLAAKYPEKVKELEKIFSRRRRSTRSSRSTRRW